MPATSVNGPGRSSLPCQPGWLHPSTLAATATHCRLRLQAFAEELLRRDGRFELVAPPRFGLLCFRLRGASDALNEELLERLNASGKASLPCY